MNYLIKPLRSSNLLVWILFSNICPQGLMISLYPEVSLWCLTPWLRAILRVNPTVLDEKIKKQVHILRLSPLPHHHVYLPSPPSVPPTPIPLFTAARLLGAANRGRTQNLYSLDQGTDPYYYKWREYWIWIRWVRVRRVGAKDACEKRPRNTRRGMIAFLEGRLKNGKWSNL